MPGWEQVQQAGKVVRVFRVAKRIAVLLCHDVMIKKGGSAANDADADIVTWSRSIYSLRIDFVSILLVILVGMEMKMLGDKRKERIM